MVVPVRKTLFYTGLEQARGQVRNNCAENLTAGVEKGDRSLLRPPPLSIKWKPASPIAPITFFFADQFDRQTEL
jgi:hypothetical protein